MKLIRAEFENFRLLRNLMLDFSTDNVKKLTVIRAENQTGKTTTLNALQWAFYGEDGLPGKGKDYRLSPLDWDASDKMHVPISVQIEFEITNIRRSRIGTIETTERYRIVRSVRETLNGDGYERSESTVKLYQLTDEGNEPIDPPQALIHETLPLELKEVFFTDGDRALSFIEATATLRTKRERVEKAIRSLLGLGVIEAALRHVNNTASDLNKIAKKIGDNDELTQITTKLEQLDEEIRDINNNLGDANLQFTEFDQKCIEIDKEIKAALSKGNKDELKRDLEQTKTRLKQIDSQQTEVNKEHSQLFESLALSRDLLAPLLESSLENLNELRDQGKLPSTTIPILEDRLMGTICICGESLDPNNTDGKHRRAHIQHLIEKSRKPDTLQRTLTELYFESRSLNPHEVADNEHWCSKYAKIAKRRDELEMIRSEHGKELKAFEVQLDTIPDANIHGLRSTEQKYIAQRDRFSADLAKYETELENRKKEHRSLVATRNNLLTKQRRGIRTLARLEVINDIEQVLQNSYERITNEELNKVSALMNKLFLKMIGADTAHDSETISADPKHIEIVQKTEISKDFDILVYGPNDRLLNPDQDLSGAARRALTLAFILALTKVSEVEAPNVIDTPLGMMSGYVKKSVFKTVIRESSQLVLFLTRSEIKDCEDIIDAEAGRVITLTNSSHYPRMLANDPQAKELKVLQCKCDHHQECQVCKRRIDSEQETESES